MKNEQLELGNRALAVQAKQLHREVTDIVKATKKAFARLAKLLKEMQVKQLHRFIQRPGSTECFARFEDYVQSLDPDISARQCFTLLRIGGLMHGAHALPEAEIEKMPVANAERMAKLKPERRTPKILKAAQENDVRTFQIELPRHLAELGASPEEIEQVSAEKVLFKRFWVRQVVEKLEETLEDGALLEGIRDADRSLSLEEKTVYAMCIFFAEAHAEEIRDGRNRAEMEAQFRGAANDFAAGELESDHECPPEPSKF